MTTNIYEIGLDANAANFAPLSPVSFLARSAEVYPNHLAIVHGAIRRTWKETHLRARRLASALARRGIGRGDTVAAMLPNVPAMVEAHFGVPMSGAVLNALHTRLGPEAIGFMLAHGESKAVLVDRELSHVIRAATAALGRDVLVIDVDDPEYTGPGDRIGGIEYEALLESGDPRFEWSGPDDEW